MLQEEQIVELGSKYRLLSWNLSPEFIKFFQSVKNGRKTLLVAPERDIDFLLFWSKNRLWCVEC